ncbi:hypothetical protein C8A05DRAFT_12978 [Staphylotrichum tortipilum]|uniref:Uncharacterized protein n=1 Tax=Staphylotrichum tortipilum TaxID=2831512 RepID=A0AAN6MQT3_9PEZI|nr:hypothetical protein C8A05DRAFT_12978 [Staphylotrichum longicolle]
MPVLRKQSTIAERSQALTLHACGAKSQEIQDKTGIKQSAFYTLLRKAKSRGYIPGGPVKQEHVEDAPKSGRPKAITPVIGQTIVDIVTKNSTTRMYSTQQIADAVADRMRDSGMRAPSRRTVLRFL